MLLFIPFSAEVITCPVEDCWRVYQQSIDNAGIRDYHDAGSDPEIPSRQISVQRELCVVVTRYNQCVLNITSLCLGNLKYYSALKNLDRMFRKYNCPRPIDAVRTTRQFSRLSTEIPPTLGANSRRIVIEDAGTGCRYPSQGTSYRYCAVFGDPHVRTFHGETETCLVYGTWPLVDNDHLTVQITNGPVGSTGHASAINKV